MAYNGDPVACTIQPGDFPASRTSVLSVDMAFPPGTSAAWQNCLPSNTVDAQQSCVDILFATLTVTNTCRQQDVTLPAGQPPSLVCTLTATGGNLPTGAPIRISDTLSGASAPQATAVTGNNPAFTGCSLSGATYACDLDPAALNAAGSTGLSTTLTLTLSDSAAASPLSNCASGLAPRLAQTAPSCVTVIVSTVGNDSPAEPDGAPALTPFKTAGDCTVNEAALSYTCTFRVGVQNSGTAP